MDELLHPFKQHRAYELMSVAITLCLQVWEDSVAPDPDWVFACYLYEGLELGFRIGFKWSSPLRSASSNINDRIDPSLFSMAYITVDKCHPCGLRTSQEAPSLLNNRYQGNIPPWAHSPSGPGPTGHVLTGTSVC